MGGAAIHPNPFGSAATIDFALSAAGRVRLVIYDVLGRPVATLSDGDRGAGLHAVAWNGRTAAGDAAPAGVYFCEITSGGQRAADRIVRVR